MTVPAAIAAPVVSILMLCYNRAHYMRQAIQSALAQTYTDFEFIIVDHGSQDAAVYAIAQEYAAQDPRIILHREPQNHGIAGGRQLALQLARGKYIATLEDDDWWQADKLQKQIALLQANPQVGLLCCAYTLVDANGQTIGNAPIPDHITPPTTDASAAGFSAHAGKLHGSGWIVRRDLLLQCGGFRTFFHISDDGDTFRRMEEVGATAAQSDCLIYFRTWHGGSWGGNTGSASARLYGVAAEVSAWHRRSNLPDPADQCANVDDLLIRFFHACNFTGKDKWRSEWRVARSFLVLGKYAELRRFLHARPAGERPHILRLYAKILGWSIKFNHLGFWTGAAAAKQPS